MCKTETLSNWGHIILGLGFYQSAVDEVQACPWRIPISSRHWQLKQSATMILPSVVIEINDFFRARSYWSRPLAARMASMTSLDDPFDPGFLLPSGKYRRRYFRFFKALWKESWVDGLMMISALPMRRGLRAIDEKPSKVRSVVLRLGARCRDLL